MATVTKTEVLAELARTDDLAQREWERVSRLALLAEQAIDVLARGVFEQDAAGDNVAVRIDIASWREAVLLLRDAAR